VHICVLCIFLYCFDVAGWATEGIWPTIITYIRNHKRFSLENPARLGETPENETKTESNGWWWWW